VKKKGARCKKEAKSKGTNQKKRGKVGEEDNKTRDYQSRGRFIHGGDNI
jgi:hypothetical protein